MVNPEMLLFGVASPYAWDVLESARRLELVAVCFDNVGGADSRLPLIDQLSMPSVPFILGISSAVNRVLAARDAFGRGLSIPTSMIDPTATVASTSVVGHGSYVNAGAVVASNTRITCHVNVNRSASVGHDNVLAFGPRSGPARPSLVPFPSRVGHSLVLARWSCLDELSQLRR